MNLNEALEILKENEYAAEYEADKEINEKEMLEKYAKLLKSIARKMYPIDMQPYYSIKYEIEYEPDAERYILYMRLFNQIMITYIDDERDFVVNFIDIRATDAPKVIRDFYNDCNDVDNIKAAIKYIHDSLDY